MSLKAAPLIPFSTATPPPSPHLPTVTACFSLLFQHKVCPTSLGLAHSGSPCTTTQTPSPVGGTPVNCTFCSDDEQLLQLPPCSLTAACPHRVKHLYPETFLCLVLMISIPHLSPGLRSVTFLSSVPSHVDAPQAQEIQTDFAAFSADWSPPCQALAWEVGEPTLLSHPGTKGLSTHLSTCDSVS